MNSKYFQNKLVTGGIPLLVASVAASVYWLLVPESGDALTDSSHFLHELTAAFPSFRFYNLCGYLLVLFSMWILWNTVTRHAVIRVSSTLYLSVFILFSAIFLPHMLQTGNILACLLLGSFFFLFHTYQRIEPVNLAFHGFFLYGIASLFFPQFIWLLPLFIVMQAWLYDVTIRTLLACIMGFVLPYWFLLGYTSYIRDWSLFSVIYQEISEFRGIGYSGIGIEEWISLAAMLLMTLWCAVRYAGNSYQDKIRTRVFMFYIMTTGAIMVLMLFLQPHLHALLLPPAITCGSIVIGQYFAVTRNKQSLVSLIILLVMLVVLFILDLWMRLCSFFSTMVI